jgi:uncharacterized membrane protein
MAIGNNPDVDTWRLGGTELSDNSYWVALGAAILLGTALRIHHLAYESLWTDEIFSLLTTDPALQFHEFWTRVTADTHPPLYYLILRWWLKAFGQSEAAARAPSALFGSLTIWAAVVSVGSALPRISRLGLALLYAVSPGAIWYAQEARSYSLLLMFAAVLTGAGVRFIDGAEAAGRPIRLTITVLTVAALLASFTHYFGFLLSVATFSACLAFTWRDREKRALAALGALSVIGCFVPWATYHTALIDTERVGWVRTFPLGDSVWWFENIAFGGIPALAALAMAAGILTAKLGWREMTGLSVTSACLVICGVTISLSLMAALRTPVLTGRNLIVLLPAIYLVAAEFVSTLAFACGRLAGLAYLAAQFVLLAQPSFTHFGDHTKEQWRESADFVLHEPGCAAGTLHVYGEMQYYLFYTSKLRPQLQLREIPEGGTADLSHEPISSCPILLWIVGVPEWDLDGLLVKVGLDGAEIEIISWYEAYVVLAKRS